MNLDEQLRAALSQEADMQNATRPDVDRLIIGGQARRRRRNTARFGVALALAVVLVGGAGIGAMMLDQQTAPEPSSPSVSTYQDNDGGPIEPGRYRMRVGGVGDTSLPISADLTFDGQGWLSGNYPVVEQGASYAGIAVYEPHALAAGSGCLGDEPNASVGDSADALAQQLARLPRSAVVQEPTREQALGQDAVHLQVQIDNDCGGDVYRVAETVNGSHAINYSHAEYVVVDFWVVEVAGTPVVVETWHEDDATSQQIDQIARTAESITFATGEQ